MLVANDFYRARKFYFEEKIDAPFYLPFHAAHNFGRYFSGTVNLIFEVVESPSLLSMLMVRTTLKPEFFTATNYSIIKTNYILHSMQYYSGRFFSPVFIFVLLFRGSKSVFTFCVGKKASTGTIVHLPRKKVRSNICTVVLKERNNE